MKILRKKSGLTQIELANKIGVTQVYVSKIERGQIDGLSIYKLLKLSKVLNCCPAELLRTLIKCNLKYNGSCKLDIRRLKSGI